jgi:signal transduction histidine kinase
MIRGMSLRSTIGDDASDAPQLPIRAVIVAGLLVLMLLWVGAGIEGFRNLAQAQQRVNDVHEAFVRGEDTLSAIRTSVLLGSIYLRDALVDTTGSRQGYRDELRKIRGDIERRLAGLARDTEFSVDSTALRDLKMGLDTYWETLELFLGADAPTTFVQGTGVLRKQVVPARTNVLSIIDRLTDLQRTAQRERGAEAAALFADVRNRFVQVGVATLLIGGIVSWLVLRRVGGLERELHRRRAAETQIRRDLERLSARLVDAQEQERRALARELHDEVGQALTALKMEVGIALRAKHADPNVVGALEEARAIAESTLHGVRDLSQLLHPSVLDDFGLPESVTASLRSFSKRTGIKAAVHFDALDTRLPAGVEVAVYRITQEALTNVARHSHASSCSVSIARRDDAVHLTIVDDGTGTEGKATHTSRGLGVIGMRERAQSLSGTFHMEAGPGRGTRITVVVPLSVHAQDFTVLA